MGSFDNELSAYLWFDYVRSRPTVDQQQVLLTARERLNTPVYRIYVVVPNDAVEAIRYLAQLKAKGLILTRGDDLVFSNPSEVEYARTQTALFLAAYNKPVQQNLETLSTKQLVPSVARFLIFKSRTDPRIRDGREIFQPEPPAGNRNGRRHYRSLETSMTCHSTYFSESERWRTTIWISGATLNTLCGRGEQQKTTSY